MAAPSRAGEDQLAARGGGQAPPGAQRQQTAPPSLCFLVFMGNGSIPFVAVAEVRQLRDKDDTV